MIKQLAFLAVIMASVSINVQAADVEAGKEAAVTCAACHGADGNSANPMWPNLAGQHSEYLKKQLYDFIEGRRENPTMTAMALPLKGNDEQIENLAAYFSSEPVNIGAASPELVELGEKIYRGGNAETGVAACIACHGPSGRGIPGAGYPALSGQQADYTAQQLNDFKAGKRSNDASQIMRQLAARMSAAEIKAVSSYIRGLH